MGAVIKVESLSKQYRLGDVGTGTLKDDFKRFHYRLMGKENPFLKIGEVNDRTKKSNSDYDWALKDINFEIEQGDVVGIIGRNGAGKSTLLKILSRTTAPTTGSVKVKGRIASLLEVGTGFHGELSGRENIYLNGAIMGLRKWEIDKKLDEIIDFAGVEKYLDTPVKRYSSGMYVRLAFAVAAHLEPDILIVDEVLAVGDREFQEKCIGKMKDVSEKGGRTVLFVSHDLTNIMKLTKKCIYMDNGLIKNFDKTQKTVNTYLLKSKFIESLNFEDTTEYKTPQIKRINVKTSLENGKHYFGQTLVIKFSIFFPYKVEVPILSFQIFNSNNIPVINISKAEESFVGEIGIVEFSCVMPAPRLYKGRYTLSAYLGDKRGDFHFQSVEHVCSFEVLFQGFESNIYLENVCTYIEEYNWL